MGFVRPAGGWRYYFAGLKTNTSADRMAPNKYPYAKNVRYVKSLQTRPGYEKLFDCVGAARLSFLVDGVETLAATVELEDPTFLGAGYVGLFSSFNQNVNLATDIAQWDSLSISGTGGSGAYAFTDTFNRANANSLGAGYTEDRIGGSTPGFHILSNTYQSWIDEDPDFEFCSAIPTTCPSDLESQSIALTFSVSHAVSGISQTVEFIARMTSTSLAGSQFYYCQVQAGTLSSFIEIFHVSCPDSDPNNAIYTSLGSVATGGIVPPSVVQFKVEPF